MARLEKYKDEGLELLYISHHFESICNNINIVCTQLAIGGLCKM